MKNFLPIWCVLLAFQNICEGQEVKPSAAAPAPALPFGGVWMPQSCEFDGQQQMNDESKKVIRLSIVGSEYRMYYITDAKEMLGRRLSTADVTVDQKAGTFEMTIKDGYKKGERVHGIYSIDGDSLKLCYGPAAKPRPKEFAAPKGSEVFNELWSRGKK